VLDRIGNCRILSEIASGGMAVVYKAVQESLNRTVAIKALKTSVASESQFAIRFEREALSLAQLQHENIIHVYDFYKERGAFFIVMEYVEGIDLYDLLDRCGRLPLDVAAVIAMQIARALDYAHYRGIIHRDIKPANIMISRQGGVKLMDFGIARDQAFGDLTQTGTGLGTPSYMSPEQILGDKLDFRSDVFSLGIVLYQMCTGRKPFIEDEHKSVMHKIRLEKHPNPRKLNPEIPRDLERIMARCMQKVPRDRWRSTQDLVLALERFLARRVEMNYHARLVQFLKNTGVISAEEAEQYLHPALAGGNGLAQPQAAGRLVARRVAGIQALIAVAVALMVGLIHLAPVGARVTAPQVINTINIAAPPGITVPADRPHGRLRVVANPWAEVWVDGKRVDTTPIAETLELEAGKHTVTFKNPYFAETSKEIVIGDGEEGPPLIVALGGRRVAARTATPEPARQAASAAAAAAANPAPEEGQRPVIVHAVRKGDTFELLAAEYYGSRDFAVFILLANGLPHPRPLKVGEKLAIPTAWKYRVQEGDTLPGLAQRYLGDARRAPFLAEFNHLGPDATIGIGEELTVPYHATHTAAGREDLVSLAATFYGATSKAELLRRYNFRGGRPLSRGESIIIPLIDVHARVPEDPDAEKRARKQREMMARAKELLPRAHGAWKIGDYAAVRSALLELDVDFLDGETSAEAAFLLGSAYIALGDRDSARRALAAVRERKPDFVVRADETSPKIGEEWKRVGGKVEDPR
jgi:eukaryotic-like serine/threonine-protein kinase